MFKLIPEYWNSATKTVLILMTLALISFVAFGIDIPETFHIGFVMVLTFYFGQKTVGK